MDNNNNPIVTGYSRSTSSPGSEDYATVKYNPAGTQQWASRYDGPGNNEDKAYAIVVDNNNNPIVTGYSRNTSLPGSEDYATVKYNPAGTQQWASRYDGTGNNEDKAYAIVVDNNGNSYVTGSSRSTSSPGSEDYATVRYSNAGAEQWNIRYNGTGNNEDKAYAIVVDNNNIYVTGSSRSRSLFGSEDYLTIKYEQSPSIGIHIISSNAPESFKLLQNFPNPFNPNTNIIFHVSKTSLVTLTIYNFLGQSIATLVKRTLLPGVYSTELDGANLSSGVYFYRMNAFEINSSVYSPYSEIKKMVLIK